MSESIEISKEDKESLLGFFQALESRLKNEEPENFTNDERALISKQMFNSMNESNTFVPGDIVDWKTNLTNKTIKGPFVVTEVLDKPIVDADEEPGSSYFREPLDIKLGSIRDDGRFSETHVDSRRIQPYTPATE